MQFLPLEFSHDSRLSIQLVALIRMAKLAFWTQFVRAIDLFGTANRPDEPTTESSVEIMLSIPIWAISQAAFMAGMKACQCANWLHFVHQPTRKAQKPLFSN